MARVEDVGVNLIVTAGPQLLDEDWSPASEFFGPTSVVA
jgi:hypothetical protein